MHPNQDVFAVAAALKAQVVLQEGKDRYIYTGRSMHPFLKEGDIIIIAANPAIDQLLLGDIIIYHRYGKYIIHRFLGKEDQDGQGLRLTVKGDNADVFDKPIAMADVVGQAIGVKRGDQYLDLRRQSSRRIAAVVAILSKLEGYIVLMLRAVYWRLFRHIKINAHLKKVILGCVKFPKAVILLFRKR